MKGIIIRRIFSLILLVMWLYFIYSMSASPAVKSTNQSGIFVSLIMNLLHTNNKFMVTLIVRKLAHYIEYFILGIVTINCFLSFNKKKIIIMLLFCLVVAVLDECHQLFVPGRSFGYFDICIDFLGSFSCIYLSKLLHIIKYE